MKNDELLDLAALPSKFHKEDLIVVIIVAIVALLLMI
jgi:hypothetical protein